MPKAPVKKTGGWRKYTPPPQIVIEQIVRHEVYENLELCKEIARSLFAQHPEISGAEVRCIWGSLTRCFRLGGDGQLIEVGHTVWV